MVVCCKGRAAAAYDATTEDWRLLPRMPVGRRQLHTAVWSGYGLVVWGGEGCQDGCYRDDGAVYVP